MTTASQLARHLNVNRGLRLDPHRGHVPSDWQPPVESVTKLDPEHAAPLVFSGSRWRTKWYLWRRNLLIGSTYEGENIEAMVRPAVQFTSERQSTFQPVYLRIKRKDINDHVKQHTTTT